jgi:FemAB-related protein (PEP-CTERM system-associated)
MTRIVTLEDKDKSEWDDYVRQSPEGTFFHLTGWKDAIEKTFSLDSIYLMAVDGSGQIRGILPLFLMRDILRRKYLVSVPYSTYAGLCSDDEYTKKKLFDRAKELAFENKVQYIEIRQLSSEVFQLPTKKEFVTMSLKLDRDEEYLWEKSINAKARNHIRKAYKEGLTVDFGREYLDEFYKVLSVNIRDLGSPNYPKFFLSNILDKFNESSDIIVVKYQEEVIGGMLFISYKNMIFNPWASSLRIYNRLGTNDMLYWEAIKYACKNGYDYFDFGRSILLK